MDSLQLRLCAIICLCSAGCGPAVSLSSDAEANGTDEGTSSAMTGGDTSASGDGPSTMTTTPPPVTLGGSESADGSSGDAPHICWGAVPLLEVPAEFGAGMHDQDGDGLDELWLVAEQDSQTVLAATSQYGALGEFPIEGFFVDIADINGDGLGDLVTVSFSAGPPALTFYPATGPFSFGAGSDELGLQIRGGFPGFVDVRNSPASDVFLNTNNTVQLFDGLGDGGFELSGEVVFDGVVPGTAWPVRGADDRAALVPLSSGGNLCGGGVTRVFTSEPELTVLAESDAENPAGIEGAGILAMATDDGGTRVYRTICTPGGVGVVALQASPGSQQMGATLLAPDSDWATHCC